MRWQNRPQSDNIIDQRATSGGSRPVRLGLGGIIFIGVALYALGGDPQAILQALSGQLSNIQVQSQSGSGGPVSQFDNEESKGVVSATLASLEKTWGGIFRQNGREYQVAPLVLFRGATETACGLGQTASGPFYCPADGRVYLDLGFMDELKALGGRGDFALAYVVAHEIGHHVQTLINPSKMRSQRSAEESVATELQADCLAGLWGHFAAKEGDFIEEGDIEEGLKAAAAVGDDHIQRATTGVVRPESFTHGSSQQRVAAFTRGFKSGDLGACSG
jgi:predicted metalloprotease